MTTTQSQALDARGLEAAVDKAALDWCGEKERETFPEDIAYFKANWRSLPGLRARVEAVIARTVPTGEAGEPVAWRYRSVGLTGKPTPWLITAVRFDDESGMEVEPLYASPPELSTLQAELDEARREIINLREASIRSGNARYALEARLRQVEEALRKISCPTQTEGLLWWQQEARSALAALSSPAPAEASLPTQEKMNQAFYVDVCLAEDRLKEFIVESRALLDSLPDHWHGEAETELRDLCDETHAVLEPHLYTPYQVEQATKRYGKSVTPAPQPRPVVTEAMLAGQIWLCSAPAGVWSSGRLETSPEYVRNWQERGYSCQAYVPAADAQGWRLVGYGNVYRGEAGELVLGSTDLDATPDEPAYAAEFCEFVGKAAVYLIAAPSPSTMEEGL